MNKLLYFLGLYIKVGSKESYVYINKWTGTMLIPKKFIKDVENSNEDNISPTYISDLFKKAWN